MYIKCMRLKGFRTYKNLSTFSFSSGYNVIVGLNGSGKSNLLLAISFVLAENMEHTNKNYYLYRGDECSMGDDYSAYVELVFDLSRDAHLPDMVDNMSELCLKRIFSQSKDTYMVNGKQMSPKDYRQFLESVNLIHFTKDSPSYRNNLHFIVKQGVIGKICNMTSEERLEIFRDSIGHRSFDKKIEDSLKLLNDSKVVYNSVKHQMGQVFRKLESLDAQKAEFLQWKKLDTRRKELQASLILIKLNRLHEEMQKSLGEEGKQRNVVNDLQRKIDFLENALTEAKLSLGTIDYQCDLATRKSELEKVQRELGELITELNELQNEVGLLEYSNEKYRNELEDLSGSIDSDVAELNAIDIKCVELCNRISTIEAKTNDMLYEQCDSKDKTLDIISGLEKFKKLTQQSIEKCQAQNNELRKSLSKCESDIQFLGDKLKACEEDISKKSLACEKYDAEIESNMETRRIKQRQLAAEMSTLARLRIQLKDAEIYFNKLALSNQHTVNVINMWLASEEASNHKQNYVGFLIDVISVKDEYKVAVEQVLDSKLFTIIVKNMECAKSLIRFVEGCSTHYKVRIVVLDILPDLANLSRPDTDVDENMIPLVDCIDHEDKFYPLVCSLLHDFKLVPNVESASKQFCKNMNCVTPDGQIFYYNGLVSGGYVNMKDSILRCFTRLRHLQNNLKKTENDVLSLNLELDQIDEEQKSIRCNAETAKIDHGNCLEQINSLRISIQHLLSIEESIHSKLSENKIEKLIHQLKCSDEQIESLKSSKGVGTSHGETHDLEGEFESLNSELLKLKSERTTLEAAKQQICERILDYKEKRNELSERMLTNTQMLEEYRRHLDKLKEKKSTLELLKNDLSDAVTDSSAIDEYIQLERENICEAIRKTESELLAQSALVGEANAKLKGISQSISSLQLTLKEAEEELLRIGSCITDKARENIITDRESVLKQLADINERCARLDFFNHLSLKDCSDLKSEFSSLKDRMERIEKSNSAIVKSIKALMDQRECNLVQMVHRMNDKMSQVFEELVPNGKIKTVLVKRDVSSKEESHSILNSSLPEIFCKDDQYDKFSGLDIKVSFGPDVNVMQPMHQLSGGQKTLVSLAFTLASQRLQIAPFYLFDEIDSALDDQYRARVAKLLQKQCQEGSQCIVTTFREQLLEPGEVFYEIKNINGISVSRNIDIREAIQIIAQEPLAITSGAP